MHWLDDITDDDDGFVPLETAHEMASDSFRCGAVLGAAGATFLFLVFEIIRWSVLS